MPGEIAELFLNHSTSKLKQMSGIIHACLARLRDEQVWERESKHENAVGNLVLHLCGNLDQYIGHVIDGGPDTRDRPAEFTERNDAKAQLGAKLLDSVTAAVASLARVSEGRLLERVVTTDGERKVLELIYQVVGHFQQHTGQIISATKRLTGEDLQIYRPPKS